MIATRISAPGRSSSVVNGRPRASGWPKTSGSSLPSRRTPARAACPRRRPDRRTVWKRPRGSRRCRSCLPGDRGSSGRRSPEPHLSGRRRAAAVHPHDFVGAFVQRPQQQAVDEAEHGAVDADAERQGHDRREREPGTVTQRPQRKARVLDEVVEPRPAPGIPRLVPQAQRVPEGPRILQQRPVRLHLPAQFVLVRRRRSR